MIPRALEASFIDTFCPAILNTCPAASKSSRPISPNTAGAESRGCSLYHRPKASFEVASYRGRGAAAWRYFFRISHLIGPLVQASGNLRSRAGVSLNYMVAVEPPLGSMKLYSLGVALPTSSLALQSSDELPNTITIRPGMPP